jgi:hypothetical protein
MNDEPNTQLDQRLRQWADEREPGSDRLARLRQAILAQTAHATATPAATLQWWQSVSGRALAAALTVLAIVAALTLWPRTPTARPLAEPSPGSPVPQAHLQALVSEMERVFDRRLVWVAETNREVLLGIEDADTSSAGPHVAVRVVVLQRSSSAEPWQAVWTGDVAGRSEELVRVTSPRDGSRLNLWTHVLPDGAVSVDTELAVGESGSTWKSTSVQQPQVPQRILSTRQGTSEFQVWQTAAILQEGAL